MSNIPDPKNPWKKKNSPSLFEYYAGFSLSFSNNIIERYTEAGAKILDPWNGAGTTTLAAARSGRQSVGVDLNPAAILIAKARIANPLSFSFYNEELKSLFSKLRYQKRSTIDDSDILGTWLENDSAQMLRGMINKINILFNNSEPNKISSMTNEHALALKIIAETLKSYIHPLTGSNPTWIKIGKKQSSKIQINKNLFVKSVIKRIDDRLNYREICNGSEKEFQFEPMLLCQDSRNLNLGQEFDLILGSPPYCTRIDYAVKTLPEAAVLGIPSTFALGDFRKLVLGSTITSREMDTNDPTPEDWGITCHDFLHSVYEHPSKASNTYYYRFHLNYYRGLFSSIRSSLAHLRTGGHFAIVVQDSYYKEIHNDLPKIVQEMLVSNGISIIKKQDFTNRGSFSLVNSAAGVYGKRKQYMESVIIGRKV